MSSSNAQSAARSIWKSSATSCATTAADCRCEGLPEGKTMTTLDRRLHAFRPDLADASLKGQVEAAHFVAGTPARVAVPVAALRPEPDAARGIDTELLYGE